MKHELYNKYNLGLLDPFFEEIFDDTAHRSNFNSIMKTDIKDNDDSYTLEVELPDVKKENINLSLDDGYLTISAKYQSNDNEQNNSEKFIRRERHFGSASRSFYIGENVKEEDIDAKLENGLLTLTIKKVNKTEKQPHYIEIK